MPYLSLTCIDKRLGEVDEPSSRSATLKTATAVLRSRARNRDDDAVRPWSDRGQPEWIPNVPDACVEVHAARGGEQNDIDASVASMYIY